jgi:hypothetical protein
MLSLPAAPAEMPAEPTPMEAAAPPPAPPALPSPLEEPPAPTPHEEAQAPTAEPPSVTEPSSPQKTPATERPNPKNTQRPEGKRSRATEGRRLKEMLGLDELEREVRDEPAPPKKSGRGNGGKKEGTGGRSGRPSSGSRPPAPAEPPPTSPSDDRTAGQVTADFLDASPVLRATARPVPARSGASAHGSELSRDTARAVDKLARMAGDLDVPEGRRAQVRAMLMGLARELDQDAPRWGVVADSIAAAMEFPPLARALLPLLLPELDRAA